MPTKNSVGFLRSLGGLLGQRKKKMDNLKKQLEETRRQGGWVRDLRETFGWKLFKKYMQDKRKVAYDVLMDKNQVDDYAELCEMRGLVAQIDELLRWDEETIATGDKAGAKLDELAQEESAR